MTKNHLSAAITLICLLGTSGAIAQSTAAQTTSDQTDAQKVGSRTSVSSTSNTTTANDTKRVQQLSSVQVQSQSLSLGGGLMSVQTASKAVSTITREAITQAAPGATFVQMIESIPGVNASTDDVTGLSNGNYSIRGFTSDEIGTTVNGAPINDSGNYKVYSTEYGDTENMGDITVLQGYPDLDTPVSGAAGGSIAWVTIDPSHTSGMDVSETIGGNDYRRTFVRYNTGDTGPVRSWISYSHNTADLWRGSGDLDVDKVDGKSLWTINENNSISASFQYNREANYSYDSLTKAQVAQYGYHHSYDRTLLSATDTNYWKLHTNPFRSWMASMDGEFKLNDSLRLSVVPYFQYGSGGGGSGTTFTESTSTLNQFKYTNQDLNGNGVIKGSDLVYSYSTSNTWRPGIIAKFNEDFGENDSLEYGFWYDRPRQEQGQVFTPVGTDGTPADYWANTDLIRYPNGQVQKTYNEYTNTDTRKVFVTNTWTPNDKWTITGGLAYIWEQRSGYDYEWPGSVRKYYTQIGSDSSATYHHVSPSVGVKYQLNDQNQFYLGAGKTFRAPINSAVLLNSIVATAPNGYGTPTSGLVKNKPETATTVDIGWRYYGDQLSANVDAYYSNLNNKQVSGYDENTGQTVYLSLPKVHMSGLTAEGSYKITPSWTVYASYAYTKAILETNLNTDTISPGAGISASDLGDGIYNTKGKTFLNTPRNSAYVRLSYTQGPFWASLDTQYHGSTWGDWSNTEKVGGYTTFNFNAGWTFHDFSSWFRQPYIKVNVFNLTDHEAYTYANNIGAFLASNSSGTKDVNGTTLYASAPYYSLLEPRTFMVTFGVSLF